MTYTLQLSLSISCVPGNLSILQNLIKLLGLETKDKELWDNIANEPI